MLPDNGGKRVSLLFLREIDRPVSALRADLSFADEG